MMIFFYIYITFIVVIEIFRRFVLNNSSSWGTETAVMAYIYLTWIGASWGVKRRIHIRINAVFSVVSDRVTGLLYILSDLVFLVVGFYAVTWFWPIIMRNIQQQSETVGLEAPQWWFMFAIVLGFVLFEFRALQALYRDARDVRAGRPVDEGAETLFGD